MLAQPPFWFIALAFLGAIGPLVFIHEFGHYIVARWCGVGAETFSIGFGREIAGWTDKRGTRWKVGWLPLGGYVRFVGDMNPASQPGDDALLSADERQRAFHLKPVWQRFLIVLAGPAANFLLAIAIIAAFIGIYGVPSTPNIIGQIAPQSAAARAGLQPGDQILAIGGRATPNFEAVGDMTLLRPGERVDVQIQRAGSTFTRAVTLGVAEEVDRFGQRFKVGRLGVGSTAQRLEPVSLPNLLPTAVRVTFGLTRSMIDGLWQIVSGRRSVKDLGGPIKMAQIAGQQASLGMAEFAQLLALFSINLGFINLLPIPMLDGGHLFLYAAEAVRRRPVSDRAQEWAFRGGLAFLLALLLFVTANDLASIGLFERLGRLIG